MSTTPAPERPNDAGRWKLRFGIVACVVAGIVGLGYTQVRKVRRAANRMAMT